MLNLLSLREKIPYLPLLALCALVAFSVAPANAQPSAFQGFEDAADLACWNGSGTITIAPSFGGILGVPSYGGFNHAEITNLPDGSGFPGYGDSKYTQFCLPPSGYQGDFSQTISVYIFANAPAPANPGDPAFWIDEAPRDAAGATAHGAASIYTAEHNFRLYATGTSVLVKADDQAAAFATITQSGWYTFQMTWRKDPNPANPVLTDFRVFDAQGTLVGSTTRAAFQVGPAPPLLSNNLGGPSYIWFTNWQNGYANNVLAIDDAMVGSTAAPAPETPSYLFFYWFFAS